MKAFEKRYRLDINRWETKYIYNKNQYWYEYAVFGNPTITRRKKIRGKIQYFDIAYNLNVQPNHHDMQQALYAIGGYGYNVYEKKIT